MRRRFFRGKSALPFASLSRCQRSPAALATCPSGWSHWEARDGYTRLISFSQEENSGFFHSGARHKSGFREFPPEFRRKCIVLRTTIRGFPRDFSDLDGPEAAWKAECPPDSLGFSVFSIRRSLKTQIYVAHPFHSPPDPPIPASCGACGTGGPPVSLLALQANGSVIIRSADRMSTFFRMFFVAGVCHIEHSLYILYE